MIKVQNVYYMLSYAFQTLSEKETKKFSGENFDYADDLFTMILAKGITKQIKRGLCREYVWENEELSSPKGKIIMGETMHLWTNQRKEVACDVDEFVENTYMNQILKSVSLHLLRSKDVAKKNKQELKRVLLFFGNVDVIDCRTIEWSRLHYNRNNAPYRMLMNICYLIVNGMLMSEADGKMKLKRFVDDQQMHTLYEKFILEYYKKHYPKCKVSQSHIPWNTDDGMIELLPRMRSDIMIEYQGKTFIIDAKYYDKSLQKNSQYGNQTIHSHNMYQIFAYVKNKDTEEKGSVTGMLLYANTDGDNPDVDYRMSGNKISVKTLDLNCDFEKVKEQLDSIIGQWMSENNILDCKKVG